VKLKTGLAIATVCVAASGCGGGGADDDGGRPSPSPGPTTSPPPPPTNSPLGGFWAGVLRLEGAEPRAVNVIALVAETGEFRWLIADDVENFFGDSSEQLFGTLHESDADEFRTEGDGVWAIPWGNQNPTGDRWGDFVATATINGKTMTGKFQSGWTTFEERVGTFEVIRQSVLSEGGASLATLQGVYRTDTESLSIDDHGTVFYQSSDDGCTGNGTAEVIDPAFNMYRLGITIEGCTGARSVRNGLTFDGLAYIGANNEPGGGFLNSALAFAVSSPNPDGFDSPHHIVWSLWADE
jgi:hypothetical protein